MSATLSLLTEVSPIIRSITGNMGPEQDTISLMARISTAANVQGFLECRVDYVAVTLDPDLQVGLRCPMQEHAEQMDRWRRQLVATAMEVDDHPDR
jgi:hypothetical protein